MLLSGSRTCEIESSWPVALMSCYAAEPEILTAENILLALRSVVLVGCASPLIAMEIAREDIESV